MNESHITTYKHMFNVAINERMKYICVDIEWQVAQN